MAKKMISIRFDVELLDHLKTMIGERGLTAYLEKIAKKDSKFKSIQTRKA